MATKLTRLQDEIVRDLKTLTPHRFVSVRLLERVPHVFGSNASAYLDWRQELAAQLHVDPKAMVIVGSSAAGVSLSPLRKLPLIRPDSDVDVAVISLHHFETSWAWLRRLGASIHALPADARETVLDHRRRLIYWATIATDKLIGHMPMAPVWVPALAAMGNRLPGSPRSVNVRLYRDFEALRAYQVNGVEQLRQAPFILGGRT